MTDKVNMKIPAAWKEVNGRANNGGHAYLSVSTHSVRLLFIWSKHRIKACSNKENKTEEKLSSLPHIKE